VLGREGFNTFWCYFCKLNKNQWQEADHKRGKPWTIKELCAQAKEVEENNLTGTDMLGVKEAPYFEIPVDRVIWPVLHTMIGMGNQILTSLVDIADRDIQVVPQKRS